VKSYPEDSQDLPSAARWYAQHGISIFPCEPRGKVPLTRHGFKDATTDQRRISGLVLDPETYCC
jgi:hypothetical protein